MIFIPLTESPHNEGFLLDVMASFDDADQTKTIPVANRFQDASKSKTR